MKFPSPLERDIEKKIGHYAKKRGVVFRKFTSPQHRAVPDRILLCPGGVIGFLEVKRKGQQPTTLQWHELRELVGLGMNVSWCDSVEDGCWFIDALLKRDGTQVVMGRGLVV